ncbi:STAS domain-containing protein [Sporosarcina sp. Marseille-Q4063]|uniref:STAS domain-containing protein n=1 Tax=Sporosarcina sp. Marseille-Q4063 TaxID=2810514 RepID=UPI001BB0BFFE|nr:STAS domain-containing protein [Sporosarcina sp. Marseille-Q4063]QUW23552.1 STAS domain-containing protein [Sporosarcina sp. Marseille-Q4063]
MSTMDKQLYDYMIANLTAISDKWLTLRDEKRGSIYSLEAGESAEALLREQNRLTNLTVTSILLNDKHLFETNKEEWAREVAESRINSNTSVPEVLGALSKARQTYWSFIEEFAKSKGKEVTSDDLLRWGTSIHLAFDELYIHFSEMYYKIMNSRLAVQQSLIEELSFPIIQLNGTIGVLPLIGNIDTFRGEGFLDYIPAKCVELDVTHLFIDLSGVSEIDTMVVQQINPFMQVLKLLGINSTLTGIRPEIAQTSVQLGLEFSHFDTYNSLQQALSELYPLTLDKNQNK